MPCCFRKKIPQMPSQTTWALNKLKKGGKKWLTSPIWKKKTVPILTIIYFIKHRLGWHRGGWFGFKEMMCWPDGGGSGIKRDSLGRWRPCSAADMTYAPIKLSGLWTAAIALLTRCTLNQIAPGLQEDACPMEIIHIMDGVSERYMLICYFLLSMTETYLAAPWWVKK